jgi:hypothetical protein
VAVKDTTRLWITKDGQRRLVVLTRGSFPDADAYRRAIDWWYEQGAEDEE